jgi:hypothetical protein
MSMITVATIDRVALLKKYVKAVVRFVRDRCCSVDDDGGGSKIYFGMRTYYDPKRPMG